MSITHLVNRRNLCLIILATILTIALLGPPQAGAALAPDDSIPYAQVLGVIVNNRVVEEANATQVVITRAPDGCAPAQVVRKGLRLCKGDRIVTQANVMLKIAFGDPKNRNEVTIGSPTSESEIKISSTECGRLCQWYITLTTPVTNWTRRVAFTNKGTVYQVVGREDDSATLYVYEGEVEAKKREIEPPSPAAVTEPAASPTPAAATEPTASPAPTSELATLAAPAPSATPLVVGQLFRVRFGVDGTPSRPEKMSDTDVCVSLNASTDAEIALHRQPAEVSGNVAKFPRWPDIATRDDNFRTFRCNSFLQPTNALNFEELGYIYNDWGDAEQALAFLAIAAEKWRARLPDWMPRERYRINRAIALRQLGQYDDALRELNPMVTDSEWLDDALNVRGSIYFDQARKALIADRTEAGTTAARELLNKANDDYEAAKIRAADQQQYVIVNLAQVSKTRGDIAQRLGDLATDAMQRDANYNEATQHYIKAIELLKDSYGNTTRNTLVNNPHNKIAGILVARARAALANTYVAMGKPQDATTYYARAEETYGMAIRDDSTFAAAYCGLASLNLILGKPEVDENYRKCVTFNPAALVGEVEVPHLIGLRRAAAIQTLAEVGLQPEIVTDGETVESQDPATGEQPVKIKIGTKVKISLQSVRQ